MLGDRAYLTPNDLRFLASTLRDAGKQADPHEAGVAALAGFFAERFPVLCETIGEVVRTSGHQRFHYWCDVAEMSSYANYHFTIDAAEASTESPPPRPTIGRENIH